MTERKPSSAAGTAIAWIIAASVSVLFVSAAAYAVLWVWTQIAGLLS